MTRFIVRRIGSALLVVFLLSTIVFGLQQTSRADPVRAKLGFGATPERLAAERHRLGLDGSLVTRYGRFLGRLVRGDFGESVRTNRPVYDDLRAFLPASLELIAAIMFVAVVLGIGIGIVTARPGARAGVVRVVMLGLSSIPAFLVTILGVLVLYRSWGILPASGRTSYSDAPTGPTGFLVVDGLIAGRPSVTFDALHHLVLPAIAGSLVPAVAIGRVLRSSLITTMASDHVRTARALGQSERQVMLRHALRNSAGPALSLIGLLVGSLFAGTLIVEQMLGWPGLGAYLVRSIVGSDFPAIAGVTIVVGAIYIAVNAVVDVVQSIVDPRVALR